MLLIPAHCPVTLVMNGAHYDWEFAGAATSMRATATSPPVETRNASLLNVLLLSSVGSPPPLEPLAFTISRYPLPGGRQRIASVSTEKRHSRRAPLIP
jgi:hypothetical protein